LSGNGTYTDIPGLIVNAPATGMYHLSATTTIQNTASTANSTVGVRILVNGQPVDYRLVTFAPNSLYSQESLRVEHDLSLSASTLIQVQATAYTGSAQFPGTNSTQIL